MKHPSPSKFPQKSGDTVEILERERRLLSADLHSGFSQYLCAVSMQLEILDRNLRSGKNTLALDLQELKAALDNTINHTRVLAGTLSPVLSNTVSLFQELQTLVKGRNGNLDFDPSILKLKSLNLAKLSLPIYRIIQEGLRCGSLDDPVSSVKVSLKLEDSTLRITLERQACINEAGFRDLTKTVMNYYINQVDGAISWRSSKNGSDKIICKIPLGEA